MKVEEIRMTLSIIEDADFKAIITLKSKKSEPFIAKVADFNYDEDDTKVILKRCEETVFPNQILDVVEDNYTLYLKNIKEVHRHY
jgi:hypothetical protein